jgi:hypothetical protein
MEEIRIEEKLLQISTIKIDFLPVLFITKSMETFEGEY